MSNLDFKTEEEFAAAKDEFFANHPEAPRTEGIDCLNLVMKREWAEKILSGEKKLEFRDFTQFYASRLIDKNVNKYLNEHVDDDEVVMFCNDIRQVEKIHFHNYNNSWFLDVECTFNDAFSVTKNDIEFLQEEYDCHEFDEDLESLEAANVPEKERPYIFYFVIGKVLDTNLETKSEK